MSMDILLVVPKITKLSELLTIFSHTLSTLLLTWKDVSPNIISTSVCFILLCSIFLNIAQALLRKMPTIHLTAGNRLVETSLPVQALLSSSDPHSYPIVLEDSDPPPPVSFKSVSSPDWLLLISLIDCKGDPIDRSGR